MAPPSNIKFPEPTILFVEGIGKSSTNLRNKLVEASTKLGGVDVDDIAACISKESGFDHTSDNGSHYGLFQFDRESAALGIIEDYTYSGIGNNPGDKDKAYAILKSSTPEQQVDYFIKRKEKIHKGSITTLEDLYLLIFAPRKVGKLKPNGVIYPGDSLQAKSNPQYIDPDTGHVSPRQTVKMGPGLKKEKARGIRIGISSDNLYDPMGNKINMTPKELELYREGNFSNIIKTSPKPKAPKPKAPKPKNPKPTTTIQTSPQAQSKTIQSPGRKRNGVGSPKSSNPIIRRHHYKPDSLVALANLFYELASSQ